jgi:large subunit ribosomal protein L9
MKVVFMEEVEGTARVGEVKNVADGFARNYLLPRKLAAPATDHYITIAQARAEKEAHRQVRLDEEAREHLVPKMEGQSVTIEVRVGEQGKLFGSVTARDIAEALQEATGVELEHRQVDLRQPIREIGSHEVTVKLTRNVPVQVAVNVEPLGGMPEGEEAPEAVGEPMEAAEAAQEEPVAEEEEAASEEPAATAAEAAAEEPSAEQPEEETLAAEEEEVAEEEPTVEEEPDEEAEAEEATEAEAGEPEAEAEEETEAEAEEPEVEAEEATEAETGEPEAEAEEATEADAGEPEAKAEDETEDEAEEPEAKEPVAEEDEGEKT